MPIFSRGWRRPSLLAALAALWVVSAPGAVVTGRVELVDSRDPGVRKHRDYSGVVVWLEPAGRPVRPAVPKNAVMLQKGKQFIPHILTVPVGSTVEFPNHDPIFHNAFSNFSGQPFDTGLYPPNGSAKVVFRREGIVRVFCNIHSSMSAVIVVLRTPYYTVTSPTGAFRISGVPPGDYQLHVWHERATEATLRSLVRKVSVPDEDDDTNLSLKISESGYLEVPHKNKFGQDYPPEQRDTYGGPPGS